MGNPLPTTKRLRSPLRVNGRSDPLQPKLVVDSISEFLLAAQISFGRLNGGVTEEKLNLFQLASREMALTSAGPAQVMWSEALDSCSLSSTSDDVPDCFG